MKQFQIQLFKEHPIINEGENRILIDTGAPSTIHASDRLNFCSESYGCSTNCGWNTIKRHKQTLK